MCISIILVESISHHLDKETQNLTDTMQPSVNMYDIRRDKSEASLLQMLKDGLSSEPKTIPTLLLYDGQRMQTLQGEMVGPDVPQRKA